MRSPLLPFAAAAALAGCGGDPDQTVPPSTEVVEDGVETGRTPAQPLRPGLWEIEEHAGDVSQATMRAEEAEEIEGTSTARTVCLPANYSDRPHADFWGGADNACAYDRFRMADGELEAALSCNATPGTITIALDGTYSETGFDLAATTTRSGSGDDVTVNGRLLGSWRDDCTAEEAEGEEE